MELELLEMLLVVYLHRSKDRLYLFVLMLFLVDFLELDSFSELMVV